MRRQLTFAALFLAMTAAVLAAASPTAAGTSGRFRLVVFEAFMRRT